MTSNEFRQVVGLKPSKDPRADELRNKNLNTSAKNSEESEKPNELLEEGGQIQNGKV